MANRRQFLRTLAGTAALSITADVTSFGRMRRLHLSAAMPDASPHDRLQPDWYRGKIRQVQEQMKKRKLNAVVLLNATNVIYTTGYFHLPTERPLAALIPASGDPALFIPELESDQVKLWWVKDYESYFDYPGPVNRVQWIFERSRQARIRQRTHWRRRADSLSPFAHQGRRPECHHRGGRGHD